MTGEIHALVVPKYGMVMTEGVLGAWHVEEGRLVELGDEIVDIETEKIVNTYESHVGGILRRRVGQEGEKLTVGSLFAVVADASVPESEIELFIEEFKRNFKPLDGAEFGPSPRFMTAGGRRIRYLRTGPEEGVPVVLVHGFGGDLHNWLFNQEALATDHPVYALDLPGHGGSQKDVGDGTIGALAHMTCESLGALNLDQAHLVGHSLGGAIALAGAIAEPRLARSLSLISPVGLGTEINGSFIGGFIQADRRKEMKGVLEQLFADPALVSREMVMNVLQANRIDGTRECLQRIAESCFAGGKQEGRLRERLSQLAIPVQVVWGKRDRIIPSAQASDLPKNVAVRMVDPAGHMVHMERAEEVNELLRRFIHSS